MYTWMEGQGRASDAAAPDWGLSLVGRAPALHAGGQRFDSVRLHHVLQNLMNLLNT